MARDYDTPIRVIPGVNSASHKKQENYVSVIVRFAKET